MQANAGGIRWRVGELIRRFCAIASTLLRLVWPFGGIPSQAGGMLPLPLPVEDAQEVPAQAGRAPIRVYPDVKGFNKSRRKKALKTLEEFHEHIKEVIWGIEDANKFYAVHFQETRVGKGLFNGGKHVPIGTRLFVYIARLVTREQNTRDGGDLSYVFPYGPFTEYDCLADAKLTVRDLNPINAGGLNHSCVDSNCKANWVLVEWEGHSEYYLEVYTKKEILPGEQFTISYNDVNPEDVVKLEHSLYMVPMASLAHLPAGQAVKCLCGPNGVCPSGMGFDRLAIYGRADGKLDRYGPA